MSEPRLRLVSLFSFLTLLLIVLIVNLKMTAPYLLAVFLGGLLALLTYPFYVRVRRLRLRPALSSLLVTLTLLLLVIGPLTLFLTLAVRQGTELTQKIAQTEGFRVESMVDSLSRWKATRFLIGDPAAVQTQIRTGIQGFAKTATRAILVVAGNVPEFLLQLALFLLTFFFFLVDGKRFLLWLSNKLPLDFDVRTRLFASFHETAVSVILSTFVTAFAQAVIIILSYLTLGVPGAFLAGVATFIFAWIPILGSAPLTAIGMIYLYFEGSPTKVVLMLVLGFAAGLIDNVIRSWILKGRNNMHPLVSLVAIFGGIHLFGIFGVFVGPILTAILISLLQIWPIIGGRFGMTFDHEMETAAAPVPPETSPPA